MRVLVLFLSLLLLVSALNAEALAVASDYLENKTLMLREGTSTIYSIRLQNPYSYESKFKVDYDKDFMKAIDFKEEYILPSESSIRIEFNVTAPKYNKDNNLFTISYTVHELTGPPSGGMFLTKINQNFKLKVVEDPNKWHINYFYLVYAIILLAIIVFLLRKKKP